MNKIGFKRIRRFVVVAITIFFCLPANAIDTGPAPAGNPFVVALKLIRDNFEKSDCPSVTKAKRIGDGSIKASCSNGETFRIFTVVQLNKAVAMKCSVAKEMGVPGC